MPARRPLWIVIVLVAALGAVLAITAQLRVSRPSDDTIDLAAGAPDPDRDPIEADLLWALDLINGADVSAEELENRLSPIMLDLVPIPVLQSETKRLALDGPYQLHGTETFPGGVAGALISSRSGDVFGLQVAVDPSDPARRLTLLGVSPADDVHRGPFQVTDFALHLGAGLALVLAGAILTNVRSVRSWVADPRFGLPLATVGLLWMAQLFELADNRWLYTLGLIAGPVAAALLATLLMALASGRNWQMIFGIVAIIAALIAAGLTLVSLSALDTSSIGLPENLLAGEHDAGAAQRWSKWSAIAGLVAAAMAVVALLARLLSVSGSRQRGLTPMALGGSAGAMALAVPALGMIDGTNLDLSQSPVISAGALTAAVGVIGSVLWQRYDLDEVATLAATADDGDGLEPLLARALGDPTAELLIWNETTDTYERPDGTRAPDAETIQTDPRRAVTAIATPDRTLGAIVHDAALLDEPDRLGAARGVAQLAMENDRLYAEVESQLGDVRASRARILEATEQGRRRIERDLHDGAQQHLLSILLSLRVGREQFAALDPALDAFLANMTDDLGSAVAELRELSRGLHPAILDRGVIAAADSLAETASLPVTVHATRDDHRCADPSEHAAYFVMTEALANASRHADATHVDIRIGCADGELRVCVQDDGNGGAELGRGTGLQNLEDRVLAIGGTFSLTSPVGEGTQVEVAVPCA